MKIFGAYLWRILIINLLALGFNGIAIAQISPQIAKGDKYFYNQEYQDAISMYRLAYQMDESVVSSRKLAETYKRIGAIEQCEKWLEITNKSKYKTAEDVLRYAEILKIREKYPEAIEQYRIYSVLHPEDKRAKEHIQNENYYKKLWNDSLKYRIHILGINSDLEAFGVAPYENNKYMFSASMVNDDYCAKPDRKKDTYLDIYACELDDNEQFVNAQRFGEPINTKFHDGPIYYDHNSATMYITRNNIKGNKPIKNKKGETILKIYTSKLIDGIWQDVKELSLNEEEYSTGHPCLSADGQTLYFISNRPGGYGGTDIYQSHWEKDHWGSPENLGPNVNTEGNEMFPFVSKEGIIYFASDGHAGLGGYDNFLCEPWGNQWSVAYNLGSPINTNNDDFSLIFVPGQEIGFFSSNRSGKGFSDIYFFKQIELLEQQLSGKLILDSQLFSLEGKKIKVEYTGSHEVKYIPIGSDGLFNFKVFLNQKVEFSMADTSLFDGEPFVAYNAPSSFKNPSNYLGVFHLKSKNEILAENLTQKLEQNIESVDNVLDYLEENTDQITKEKLKEIAKEIDKMELASDDSLLLKLFSLREKLKYLSNLIYEKEYIVYDDTEMYILTKEVEDLNINNIYFGFDSYVIAAKASNILDSIVYHMKKNQDWKIEIDTHTDSRGSSDYNRYLSKERANAVRRYLKNKGIATDRILMRWHGENDLITQEKNESDYQLNRRAEFRYLVNSNRNNKYNTGYINEDKQTKEYKQ